MGLRLARIFACVAMCSFACSSDATPSETVGPASGVRIASFDFAESELVAELYAQALEHAGFEVIRLGPLGPREVVAPALELGHVDVVPEYLGTAAGHFGSVTRDLVGLRSALAGRGLVALEPAPAVDVNVFVVAEELAAAHGLRSLSDLGEIAGDLRFGGPVECPDRPLCLPGLGATYGLTFAEFVPMRTLAITASALSSGEIDVGLMFSTASELSLGSFVVLEDDRALQPAEHLVPIVHGAALDRWGTLMSATLDELSATISTEDLQAMNRRVADGEPLADVAGEIARNAR